MRIARKIVITIFCTIILFTSFSNMVIAANYVYEKKHQALFHDSAHVVEQLKKYGYQGNLDIQKEQNENNYREVKWDMKATIKIVAEESPNEKGKYLYTYVLYINDEVKSRSPYAMEKNVIETSAKGALNNIGGFNYTGRLSAGENNIEWTEYADIKIKEWHENGKKFKYSYGIYGVNKNATTDVDENKSISSVKFDEKNAKDMNSAERYVKPGSYCYDYNSVMNVMTPKERLTGEDAVYVLKKDESSGWCKVKLSDGTECYIQSSNLLIEKAPSEQIEAEKQKQEEENETIQEQVENGDEIKFADNLFAFDESGVWMEDIGGTKIQDPTNEAEIDSYNPYNSDSALTDTNSTKILELGKTVIGIVNVIATVVAVLVLTALGIKYMMSSIEEKAEFKETMIPYIIGTIFIFSSTTLVNIIYNFAMSFNK